MSISTTTEREIRSQPEVWARAAAAAADGAQVLGRPGERVLVLGCGTSAFVAESLAVLRERAGQGETDAAYASEWTPGRGYDRVVVISRSGTTSEVLEALGKVPEGTRTSAVVGVAGTPVAEAADEVLVLDFADEESVVQTRFPTAVLVLARTGFGEDLTAATEQARAALDAPLPVDVTAFEHFVFLGRTWTYGLAQEAALKIREAAQAWSESYPALDYRHGPVAVAGERSLVTLFGDADPVLTADIERTGATVRHDDLDPLVQLVQAQRLAVEVARSRGLDADTPRHLTRSVVLG
ncbi:SIS domain-containing protein [Promicromonospora thailandica]|uniref:Fructoselysine-6-P-deglycase FrlB with duplicated sugar isomerase (SIS) domain n=1 Tax=Promicromonospora thailandica TaxID=765201 RepID=A0A9X2G6K6_9MICO|nr:SIS domain-containing protein [Promicromonospora thailandica]MCP2266518.1 Fructoselysine-6-P-deglycase FrlB with duplicated sugar isomerase (SIS) domain [Promicromonospora thailandica]